MRPVAYLALAILAGGCDLVFAPGSGPSVDAGGGGPDGRSDGPPGDRDDDGLADVSDRCPDDYNPLDLDEDEDGTPDACDDCIGINAPQSDGDRDDIGDACDLFPTDPNTQLIHRFFVENGELAPWAASSASFLAGMDSAVSGNNEGGDENLIWSGPLPASGTLWVETGFMPGIAGAGDFSIGVWLDADLSPTPANGSRCDVRTADIDETIEVVHRVTGGDLTAATRPATFGVADPFVLQALTSGIAYRCGQVAGNQFSDAGTPAAPRRLGLHTRSMSGVFQYVLVYHQP